jgi:SOS-response transcriptional repressor LexA
MKTLTMKQKQILEYFRNHVAENDFPSSFREVVGHFKINLGTVQDHINALPKKDT